MKDEIKEILDKLREQYNIDSKLGKEIANEFGNYQLNYKELTLLLDYITNLQKTNKNLKGCIEDTNINYKNIITNLEEELKSANESISWWQNRFNAVEKENKKLKELCNKYEEEHSTAFKLWTMKMEEMPDYEEKMDYKSRIDKAIEYIKEHRRADLVFKLYLTEQETDNVLNILQGGDK